MDGTDKLTELEYGANDSDVGGEYPEFEATSC
jgi:hypothetical protein